MRNLSRVIGRLRTKAALTVTRTAAPILVKGRSVAGLTSTFPIRGSIQPLTDKEIQFLPEGLRATATWALFTDAVLTTDGTPDQVTFQSVTYTVKATQDWQANAAYARYVLVKNEVAAP